MENKLEPIIKITIEELKAAVARYDTMLPGEVADIYETMLAVPEFGARVAVALQNAVKMANKGNMDKTRVFDAGLVPAFVVGALLGIGRDKHPQRDKEYENLMTSHGTYPSVTALRAQMKHLKDYAGQGVLVDVDYVDYGRRAHLDCYLHAVHPGRCIEWGRDDKTPTGSIPFIGSGCAIIKIMLFTDQARVAGKGLLLYYNPAIPVDYDLRMEGDVDALRKHCFGMAKFDDED